MSNDMRRGKDVLSYLDTIVSDPNQGSAHTLLNRMFLQGPDPKFLWVASSDITRIRISEIIGLAPLEIEEAIFEAHEKGPSCLLDPDPGFTRFDLFLEKLTSVNYTDTFSDKNFDKNFSRNERKQIAWILLASMSHCEEGLDKSISAEGRIRYAFEKVVNLHEAVAHPFVTVNNMVEYIKSHIFPLLNQIEDEGGTCPTFDDDLGFYVGYASGFDFVKVRGNGCIFYGTVPTSTLEKCGVQVDVKISDQFGFVYTHEGS